MKIALIGYGKMGKEIRKIAESRGHEVSLIIDIDNATDLNIENLKEIDVAIDFSSPASAFDNIVKCIEAGTPVVSGTTGWLDRWDEAQKICQDNDGGLFYASNYSIGVNILFAVNTYLAEIMDHYSDYEVSMEEIHHIHKLDAPSGTAISLSDQVCSKLERKEGWSLQSDDTTRIHINAKREGEVNGYHSVTYDSDVDTITLLHNAKSRKGFALGAVLAAEYIKGKSGIHSMKDMLPF